MPRQTEARLRALEQELGTEQTDWAAIQRKNDEEFFRCTLALFVNVERPQDHPELSRQVANLLEPINPPMAEAIRIASAEGKSLRQLVAETGLGDLVALFDEIAAAGRSISGGSLESLYTKLGKSIAEEGDAWDPARASVHELFAVALGYGKQVQPEETNDTQQG